MLCKHFSLGREESDENEECKLFLFTDCTDDTLIPNFEIDFYSQYYIKAPELFENVCTH